MPASRPGGPSGRARDHAGPSARRRRIAARAGQRQHQPAGFGM